MRLWISEQQAEFRACGYAVQADVSEYHTIIAVPESPMFNAPEAAEVTVPRLELVKQAGRQYAETGEIDEKLLAEICSPILPEDVYAAICNKEM